MLVLIGINSFKMIPHKQIECVQIFMMIKAAISFKLVINECLVKYTAAYCVLNYIRLTLLYYLIVQTFIA